MAEFTVPSPRLEYHVRHSNGPAGLDYQEGGTVPLRNVHRVFAYLEPRDHGRLHVHVEGMAVRADGKPSRRKRLSYPIEGATQPDWLMRVVMDAQARLELDTGVA